MELLSYLITEYRTLFAVLFLLPLSALFDSFLYIRNKLVFWFQSAPEKHKERVQNVQRQIREWNDEGRTKQMCTARPGWMAMSLRVGKYKSTHKNIRIHIIITNRSREKKIVLESNRSHVIKRSFWRSRGNVIFARSSAAETRGFFVVKNEHSNEIVLKIL
jgi:hypothetical protein